MRELSKQEALNLKGYNLIKNPSFAVAPATLDFCISRYSAPLEFTSTAFLVGITKDDLVVLANNCRRGMEISGGHVEAGEDLVTAAQRENKEETGSNCIGDLIPVGFERIISCGNAPEGYKYPFPVGFQQFFAALVEITGPYEENDECLKPIIMPIKDALASQLLSINKKLIINEAFKLVKK